MVEEKQEEQTEEVVGQADYQAKLFEALTNVQQKFINASVKKDTQGYGYKYANLDNIIQALTPILLEEGLTYLQSINDGRMDTVISNGYATVRSSVPFEALSSGSMNNMQKLGATITYLKRYGLSLAFGLSVIEDTDGSDKTEKKKTNAKSVQVQQTLNTKTVKKDTKAVIDEVLAKKLAEYEKLYDGLDDDGKEVVKHKLGNTKLASADSKLRDEVFAIIDELSELPF